jgi:hypothetical protein
MNPCFTAQKKLDELGQDAALFVIDKDQKLVGSLTDGDIRRGLIKGLKLEQETNKLCSNRKPIYYC